MFRARRSAPPARMLAHSIGKMRFCQFISQDYLGVVWDFGVFGPHSDAWFVPCVPTSVRTGGHTSSSNVRVRNSDAMPLAELASEFMSMALIVLGDDKALSDGAFGETSTGETPYLFKLDWSEFPIAACILPQRRLLPQHSTPKGS